MKPEQEQLELAAKACGYIPATGDSDVFVIFEGNEPRDWNPLTDHPDAPHGFSRNASHSVGRYVCECEGWVPDTLAVRE